MPDHNSGICARLHTKCMEIDEILSDLSDKSDRQLEKSGRSGTGFKIHPKLGEGLQTWNLVPAACGIASSLSILLN